MVIINNLADMNEAVAIAAFCPKPPLSERRARHGSGAWGWVKSTNYRTWDSGHWEPAQFATDPAASYALRQKMRELGYRVHIVDLANHPVTGVQIVKSKPARLVAAEDHKDELIALCLAALRALNVEFELAPGWDAR